MADLSVKQEQCITLLLLGEKKTDIAKKLKVTRRTVYDWVKKPEFIAYMEQKKSDCIIMGDNYLMSRTQTYIEALNDIAMNTSDEKLKASTLIYLVNRTFGVPISKVEVKAIVNEEKALVADTMNKTFDRFNKKVEEIIDIEKIE